VLSVYTIFTLDNISPEASTFRWKLRYGLPKCLWDHRYESWTWNVEIRYRRRIGDHYFGSTRRC